MNIAVKVLASNPEGFIKPVNLQECPEEFDETIREAKFALRTTDLGSWTSAITFGRSAAGNDERNTTNSTIFKRF